jgi:hypothetical protein
VNKVFLFLFAVPLASAFGQGRIRFETDFRPLVDAPVTLPSLGVIRGPGPQFSAQLFIASGTTLLPLSPATTFRAAGVGAEAIADRYVVPTEVTVTNLQPGSSATLVMRVWKTSLGSYENARLFAGCDIGESIPFTITLGGGDLPAAPLSGLQGFTLGNLGCYRQLPFITAISKEGTRVIITADRTTSNTLLQVSSNLQVWNDLLATITALSGTIRTFTIDANAPREYYRLVEP